MLLLLLWLAGGRLGSDKCGRTAGGGGLRAGAVASATRWTGHEACGDDVGCLAHQVSESETDGRGGPRRGLIAGRGRFAAGRATRAALSRKLSTKNRSFS